MNRWEFGKSRATLNILMMAVGYGSARLLRLKAAQAIAIAIVIATSILKQGDLAVLPGVYSLIMFMTGAVVMYYFGVYKKPAAGSPGHFQ